MSWIGGNYPLLFQFYEPDCLLMEVRAALLQQCIQFNAQKHSIVGLWNTNMVTTQPIRYTGLLYSFSTFISSIRGVNDLLAASRSALAANEAQQEST